MCQSRYMAYVGGTCHFFKRKNGRKDTADRRVKTNNEMAPGSLTRPERLA